MAAVSIIPSVLDYFNEDIVRKILPKTKSVYRQNGGDVKIVLAVLACISKILNKMDKMVIVEEVLPILFEVKLADVNVLIRVLGKYEVAFYSKALRKPRGEEAKPEKIKSGFVVCFFSSRFTGKADSFEVVAVSEEANQKLNPFPRLLD